MSESERLERLVTDLLDFAHTKEPQISEFDLVDILSDLKDDAAIEAGIFECDASALHR